MTTEQNPATGRAGSTDGASDGLTGLTGLVANRHRAALLATAAELATGHGEIATAFDGVGTALAAGAWEGPSATAWSRELRRVRAELLGALSVAAADCAAAAGAQPEQVTPGDPRALPPPEPGARQPMALAAPPPRADQRPGHGTPSRGGRGPQGG
ncbi:MAG: hypothetical protein IRZ08_01660 [Frankia sp.]|nr:hypothetical protein [Frankia sp.]